MSYKKVYKAFQCWSESIPWFTGYEYLGHSVTKKKTHWLLVVKVRTKKKKKLVMFVDGSSMAECIKNFNRSLTSKTHLRWRPSKF